MTEKFVRNNFFFTFALLKDRQSYGVMVAQQFLVLFV